MTDFYGQALTLRLFGSSHQGFVGGQLSGIPAGIYIDPAELQAEMARRAPGQELSSPRRENDKVLFTAGVVDHITTGEAISFKIPNKDVRLSDYKRISFFRPSHGDYTYSVKFPGREDNRPSGRMTAPLTVAGFLCKQALKTVLPGVSSGSHILQLHNFREDAFPALPSEEILGKLRAQRFPCLSENGEALVRGELTKACAEGDSLGGFVETAFIGLPVGLGEPFFHNLDAELSALLFSVPGVKGLEFGEGACMAGKKGSEHNDPFITDDNGRIMTRYNTDGGVQGGLSNGMPLCFRVLLKPTPSIAKPQESISFDGQKMVASIGGRHDPALLIRAIPVIEACGYIALYELYLRSEHASETRNLARIRAEISQLDDKLALLIKARSEAVSKVSCLKAKEGIAVSDPAREQEETKRLLNAYFEDTNESERARFTSLMQHIYQLSKEQQHEAD